MPMDERKKILRKNNKTQIGDFEKFCDEDSEIH